MAVCINCHTPAVRGQSIPGMEFAGGFELNGALPAVTSANITPDPTGIFYYDENLFRQVMRTGKVRARELSAVMPFVCYRHMTDEDLKAIFAYLRTVPPVHHRVDNTLPPTPCRLCKGKHGAGDQN
jgi:mono/diheme cytochrome c family protein